jgi:glycosyltransferase involved in cell wall biosynthesis
MTRETATPDVPRVVFAYHCVPHYRDAVMRELIRSDRFHIYVLACPVCKDRSTVKVWDNPPADRFAENTYFSFRDVVFWQTGLLRLAWRKDTSAIVYLGNAYWPATWLSALLARLRGKHVLFWTHGWRKPDQHFLKRRFRCTFYKIAHDLLFYGHTGKMHGINAGLDPDSIHVIYNSLDYDWQCQTRATVTEQHIRQCRTELFPESSNPLVFFSGRLIPSCRLDMLLDAMAILRDDGHPVDALIVGSGPEQDALQQQARMLELNVRFYGSCYDEAVLAKLIMASNVTVSPRKDRTHRHPQPHVRHARHHPRQQ